MLLGIVSLLEFRSRVIFGAASPFCRDVVASQMRSDCARALTPFSLSLLQLRFLQSATVCLVAGSMVAHILEPQFVGLPFSLDIFCPLGLAICTKDFLTRCLPKCQVTPMISNARHLIRSGWCLRSPDNAHRRILVYEATSTDPMRTVVSGPTTIHFGAWSLEGLWHGYPSALSAKLFLSSPRRLPSSTIAGRHFLSRLMKLLTRNGMIFTPGWPRRHRCAHVAACPSAYRTTQDGGCLIMRFPDLPSTASGNEDLWHRQTAVAWTLGDWRCEGSELDEKPVVSATYDTGVFYCFSSYSQILTHVC